MENSISVHVFNRLEQLINVELDAGFGQVCCSSLDSLVKVHFHELKDEGKSTRGLITVQISENACNV